MVPLGLIATARIGDARPGCAAPVSNLARSVGCVCTGLKKRGGSCTPSLVCISATGQSLKLGWGYGCVCGGGPLPLDTKPEALPSGSAPRGPAEILFRHGEWEEEQVYSYSMIL